MLGLSRRLVTAPRSCLVLKQNFHINVNKIYKTRIAAAHNHRQLSSLQLGGRAQSTFSRSHSPYLFHRGYSNDSSKMGGEDFLPCPVNLVEDTASGKYDAVCIIDPDYFPEPLEAFVKDCRSVDKAFDSQVSCFKAPDYEKPFIYAPIGQLSEYHDVRAFQKAIARAVNRAIKAGSKNPLIVVGENSKFKNVELCVILGALEALYVPIQLREDVPEKKQLVESLQIYFCGTKREDVFKQALLLESARFVARDIGVGDPERMTAIKVQEYVKPIFNEIEVTVIADAQVLTKEYPLFQAVNRAANSVPRHQGRIIFLRYKPPQKARKSLLLVGKGVTYDTGGADIKAGGIMAGMSRDKCGAAAVAGFMKLVEEQKPNDIEVIAALCMVRNSVGEECYVADEVITSRAGVRVRVGNTDAEGRMCMADALAKMKELAQNMPDPHLFTIATLTGHACLAVGEGYSIAIDNSVARKIGHAEKLKKIGDEIGEPFEISTLRHDDFQYNAFQVIGEDLRQCGNQPSSRTQRGHQVPAAFMISVTGLDKHGLSSSKPLKYTHIDIAASAGEYPNLPTAAPIIALAKTHLDL